MMRRTRPPPAGRAMEPGPSPPIPRDKVAMVAAGALLVLLAAATPASPFARASFTSPDPATLREIRRRHRPGQLLRVTSGAQRFQLRAHEVDAIGLTEITPAKDSAPASDPFPWSRIERIDILTSRGTYGKVMGALVGGLGGMLIPALPNGYRTNRPHEVRNWFLGGLLVGGWGGGYLGSRVIREHALYVAPVPAAEPALAADPPAVGSVSVADTSVADTTAPAIPPGVRPPAPSPVAVEPREDFTDSPLVARARRRITSGDLLRIDGTFGRFQGYAAQVDGAGFTGLRTEPTLSSVGGLRALGWKEIHSVDVRGGSAGKGAMRGAVLVGSGTAVLGALLGMAIDSIGGGQGGAGPALAGGAVGFAAGGAVGALLGAAIGAGVPSWHNVYQRP